MLRAAAILVLVAATLLISPAPQVGANALPYYWLPWTAGESRVVTQGNSGPTHTGGTYYAWDFDHTANNWLVRAARGGGVSATKDDSNTGGSNQSFNPYTNYVKIDTGDGYETLYAAAR